MLEWDQLSSALENPNYIWRTIRGMAKQLDATPKEIRILLDQHASEVIKSSIPAESGEELYTTRRHYRKMASPLDKITSSTIGTVSSSSASSSSRSSLSNNSEEE